MGELKVDGTCRVVADGRTYEVFGALGFETVTPVPRKRTRGKLLAIASDILNPSADRVQPTCDVAGTCGGCSLMHVSGRAQLKLKEDWLRRELAHEQVEMLQPLEGPVRAYRAKARLGVRYVAAKERVLVGFREKLSGFVTDTVRCDVLAPPLGDLVTPLAEMIGKLGNPRCIPQVEVTALEGQAVLVFRHLEPFDAADEERLLAFAKTWGVHVYLQPAGPDTMSMLKGQPEVKLSYQLPRFGVTLNVSPGDFVQVNTGLNREMVGLAIDLLDCAPDDRVADLFCGIGNFGLAAATVVQRVAGFDSTASAIGRANDNAQMNGIGNARFEVRDLMAEDLSTTLVLDANKVILDPPRSGALAVSKLLVSSNVERVVYVSCNPVTLARDVNTLIAGGFELVKAGIMDMFPHTTHVESIALLTRR